VAAVSVKLASIVLVGSLLLDWTAGCGGSTTQQSANDGGGDRGLNGHDATDTRDTGHASKDAGTADNVTADVALDAAGDAGDAGPCGMRTGQRGLTHRKMTVAGLARTYLIYLPTALDPSKPVPLVFVHHGYTMSGQGMYTITEYSALADSEGIGVAFPDKEVRTRSERHGTSERVSAPVPYPAPCRMRRATTSRSSTRWKRTSPKTSASTRPTSS
jgi:hypothetical protein